MKKAFIIQCILFILQFANVCWTIFADMTTFAKVFAVIVLGFIAFMTGDSYRKWKTIEHFKKSKI